MQNSDIRYVFNRVFNGYKNFMTGKIVAYGKRGKLVWELSATENEYTTANFGRLYGVTVIELPNIKRKDLSRAFSDRAEAEAFIRNDFQEAS